MPDERQPLQYVAPAPLDLPGSKYRIEESADGLFITIPPPKIWIVLAGPAIGLAIASIPLAGFGYLLLRQSQTSRGVQPESLVCSFMTLAVFGWMALYNLIRMARAGTHGRKSIHIAVRPDAITIDDGSSGTVPESIAASEFINIQVQESSPTMTLGQIVRMRFDGKTNYVGIQFYTREWNLGTKLKQMIYARVTGRMVASDDHAAC